MKKNIYIITGFIIFLGSSIISIALTFLSFIREYNTDNPMDFDAGNNFAIFICCVGMPIILGLIMIVPFAMIGTITFVAERLSK